MTTFKMAKYVQPGERIEAADGSWHEVVSIDRRRALRAEGQVKKPKPPPVCTCAFCRLTLWSLGVTVAR